MARLPRFVLPGLPQHLIQRGHHGQPILRDEEDYWFLWGRLRDAAARFRCDVHAYVLMPDHFHLLLTPWRDDALSKLMQYTGRYLAQYINQRYERSGPLWDGRYRATLLDPDRYLLPVSRYIETNAVRAAIVDNPAAYDWSSYGANALGIGDELLSAHPVYLALGETSEQRRRAYRGLSHTPLDDSLVNQIRKSTHKAWVLGDDEFCRSLKSKLNRRASPRARGGDRRSAAYRQARQPVAAATATEP
jgi:putative transposase